MEKTGKLVAGILVAAVALVVIASVVIGYMRSPRPEVIGTQQTWAHSFVGSQPLYINVTVRNNGPEGQVTVFIEYQTSFDAKGNAVLNTKSQQVYMLAGETQTVNFTLYRSYENYVQRINLPQLTRAYAQAS